MATQQYQVYGLDKTYPYLGTFSFKIVLHPKLCKADQEFTVTLVDSDRKSMKYEVGKWGRKINVSFIIDQTVSDGVSTAIIKKNDSELGRLTFWVIKP